MAVVGVRVTVADSATLIATGDVAGTRVVLRAPSGGVTVSLGGSNVTTSNGFNLTAGEPLSIDLDSGEKLYGVVASSTQVVHTLASGVNSGSSGYPYS